MSVTIALNDDLAARLDRQAKGHRVSLQEWAVRILADAAEGGNDRARWSAINARRLALIAKEYTSGLSDAEQDELAALQEACAKACELQDWKLLNRFNSWEASAQSPSINSSR